MKYPYEYYYEEDIAWPLISSCGVSKIVCILQMGWLQIRGEVRPN